MLTPRIQKAINFGSNNRKLSVNKTVFVSESYAYEIQEALQMQRDHTTHHKCEILHLRRLVIGE